MITLFSIKNNNIYEEKIKYSRFISLIFRVTSKEEVNKYIDEVKLKYPNATHYCYGYVIDQDIKSSDDKEPSGTTGYPILNQITSNKLNQVLIVVVRYFGGVKLGVGPLTRAYAKVAREAITKDNIIELTKGYNINITFDYNNQKEVNYLLSNSKIINKVFDKEITYQALVGKDTLNKLSKYNIEINKDIYIEK